MDEKTLCALHYAHIQNIPFETLDLFLKRPFKLTFEELYAKIVSRQRGGYCYELSGLFSFLLDNLGFDVSIHNAQLFDLQGNCLPKSQHMVLIVKLEKRWIADVGYGNGFLEPLLLDHPHPQIQGHRTFRCIHSDSSYIVQEQIGMIWHPLYIFTLQEKNLSDFEERNQFHQTNPSSVFFGKRICMVANSNESLELVGNKFIRTIGAQSETETHFIPEQEIADLLKSAFGIVL